MARPPSSAWVCAILVFAMAAHDAIAQAVFPVPFGIALRQGRRKTMFDFHRVVQDIPTLAKELHHYNTSLQWPDADASLPSFGYYALFDGHEEEDAARFAAGRLHRHVASHPRIWKAIRQVLQLQDEEGLAREEKTHKLLHELEGDAYKEYSSKLGEKKPKTAEQEDDEYDNLAAEVAAALSDSFVETDKEFIRRGSRGGTTATVAVIAGSELVVAWVGDSRAVMCCDGRSTAVQLTNDHRPTRDDERARVERAGGSIHKGTTWRVDGILALTRAIGDSSFKDYVVAIPEVKSAELLPGDQFLIIATDGLWDVYSNQEAVDFVRLQILKRRPLNDIANELALEAYRRKSGDNISIMIVYLRSVVNRLPHKHPRRAMHEFSPPSSASQ
eukprot:TRINITY_DN4836_c0_g1_i1.p1 TRINITY_DN4836_c0_g1~~TRINITY_DN4836_c0_g1_i1.p1  ORF type:complete len:387 (+),score=88.69 TRINITY_DN4836_c0_g1_i1:62-1222(+)